MLALVSFRLPSKLTIVPIKSFHSSLVRLSEY